MTFGENLKKLRESKGITQRDLGERLGIKQQSVAQYEKLIEAPKESSIKKIANALNVDIDSLIGWDKNKSVEENLNDSPIAAKIISQIISEGIKDKTFQISFSTADYTPEELSKILEFADFVKSRRDKDNSTE